MHLKNYGVPQDITKAEDAFQRAAADNNLAAWFLVNMFRQDPTRREEVLMLYKQVTARGDSDDEPEDYFYGQDLEEVREMIDASRKWCEEQFGRQESSSTPQRTPVSVLGKRSVDQSDQQGEERTRAVNLYGGRASSKKPRVSRERTPEELRQALIAKLRQELEQVQEMDDDRVQELYGYPDDARVDDEDKKWCNEQVVQAALSTGGRIVVLDAKYFGTSRALLGAGVDASRITCPQLDAATLETMRAEQQRDATLAAVNVQEGSLGHHLNQASETSIGVVFADYTGMWDTRDGPRMDVINLLDRNKMRADGKIFVTVTLQRQSVETIFNAALDMAVRVFAARGWQMFTSKTYKMMAFVGFQKM